MASNLFFRELPLTRVLPAPTSPWSEGFYLRNMWNWIEKHGDNFDTILVDSLSLIAPVRLNSSLKQKKYILRFEHTSRNSLEAMNRPSSAIAWMISSPQATFIVSNAHEHRLLIGMGVINDRIVRLDPVSIFYEPKSAQRKRDARAVLRTLSMDFVVPDGLPLVVVFLSGEDYEAEHQCMKVLANKLELATGLRAWVFGANELIRRHFAFLKDRGVHHDVLLHSSFDEIDLLIDAADVLICPKGRIGHAHYYPTAIATATPTLPIGDLRSEQPVSTLGDYVYHSFNPAHNLDTDLADFLSDPTAFQNKADQIAGRFNWDAMRSKFWTNWQQLLGSTN